MSENFSQRNLVTTFVIFPHLEIMKWYVCVPDCCSLSSCGGCLFKTRLGTFTEVVKATLNSVMN